MFNLIKQAAKVIAVRKLLEAALPAPVKPTNGAVVLTPTGVRHLLQELKLSSDYRIVNIRDGVYKVHIALYARGGKVASEGDGTGVTEQLAVLNAHRAALYPLIKWSE